jgi:uncharacterized protein YbjQ (UPF0145 family)
MQAASALNADDIINVRVDTREEKDKTIILAASAVAIKYTDEIYEDFPWLSEEGERSFDVGEVLWSNYTWVPEKDFTTVGIVSINCETSQTPAGDLMDAAKALGADDIFNVRVDRIPDPRTKKPVAKTASAVAIKYTKTHAVYRYKVPTPDDPVAVPDPATAPAPQKKKGLFGF